VPVTLEIAAAAASEQRCYLLDFSCSTQQGVGTPIRSQRKAHREPTIGSQRYLVDSSSPIRKVG
jgi:hypothetical protein